MEVLALYWPKHNQCLLVVLFVQCNVLFNDSKYHVPKFPEQASLQGLVEIVCDRISSWIVLDTDLFLFEPVSDEEISDVNVFGSFGTRESSIILHENGDLVVLA